MATGWKATGRRHLSWGIWGNTVKRWRWDKRPPGKSMAATAAECTGSSRQQEELGPLSSHFQNIFFTTIFKSEIEANHSHPPLNSMKWYLLSRLFRDSDMASLSKNKTKQKTSQLLSYMSLFKWDRLPGHWAACPALYINLPGFWGHEEKPPPEQGVYRGVWEAWGFPGGSVVRLPTQETQKTGVWSLGGEDPLEEETATHSSIFAWRIPWTEEPGGLRSKESENYWGDLAGMHACGGWRVKGHTHNDSISVKALEGRWPVWVLQLKEGKKNLEEGQQRLLTDENILSESLIWGDLAWAPDDPKSA